MKLEPYRIWVVQVADKGGRALLTFEDEGRAKDCFAKLRKQFAVEMWEL